MYRKYSEGMIEIITGPMFSGKSDELLKRIVILNFAGINTLVIKPKIDKRFSENKIVSRTGAEMDTLIADNVQEIKNIINKFSHKKYKAIAIDEVQFFNKELIELANELADSGWRVILSGLDTDYLRRPFGIIPELMSIAEHVTKLQAVCVLCKNAASTTFRKSLKSGLKVIGDTEDYEARCRVCHIKGEYAKLNKSIHKEQDEK